MNHTQTPFSSSSSSSSSHHSATITTAQQSAGGNPISMGSTLGASRHWRDVFWLGIFVLHLILVGFALGVLGFNRFRKKDRLNIDQYTIKFLENQAGLTEDYWPLYAVAAAISTVMGWVWLLLLGSRSNQMMKVSVHILTTYLAVLSVLCFWGKLVFWGVAFAIGSGLQFLYIISVIDRLPFTMLVLQRAVKMVWKLPEVMRVACAFMLVMLLWLVLWSFGAAGVVASGIGDGGRWWLLAVFSVSLFWTGAVLCNTVHVIVSGMVFLVLIHGGRDAASMPRNPLLQSLRHAVTTSFGMETLVRFFNKYAYVQIAVYGKNFNHSARDAWELFQSTGVEALVAYDCSGAVLLMGTLLGGLITGTCAVGLAMVVVESAVTSIYICYAEDPLLIHRWDPEFFNQMSETLHQRLQHRSARAREGLSQHRLSDHIQETISI
ncbi:Choline transporter-like protein [Cynara cardunculus var. scolymus]|uniref:Choline transporter-like protein n=1 Tax=Cynara cardunculus var. scolymus TaxID=59895 RepID=A0A103XVC6_CYNCS|nr:Choline transporter-like protein [Cynara cardunculus var. scolymus]